MTIYKKDKQNVVWVKEKNASTYTSLITYDFCMLSGSLGPKRGWSKKNTNLHFPYPII